MEIEEKTKAATQYVGAWLDEADLTLATHKTKAALISGRKIVEKMEMTVGGKRIESKRAIKYLEVIVDDRFKFKEHVHRRKGIYNTTISSCEDDAKY